MSDKKIVITGANGFIGFNCCLYFLKQNVEIAAVVNPSSPNIRIKELASRNFQLKIIECDLRDHDSIYENLNFKADYFYHFAALGISREEVSARDIDSVNHLSLKPILTLAKTFYPKILICGSGFEYRTPLLASESDELLPENTSHEYAKSKLNALKLAEKFAQNLEVKWVRPYTIYGPFESNQRLITYAINCARKKEIPYLETPEGLRDFLFIDDFIEALITISSLSKKGIDIYNVGSGDGHKVKNIVAMVYDILGLELDWKAKSKLRDDPPKFIANIEKIQTTGWKPKVSLKDGIVRLLENESANINYSTNL